MDNCVNASKVWTVEVTFRGKTKAYKVRDFGILSVAEAKNIAFLMFIEDVKGELANECRFELFPTDHDLYFA